MRITAFKIAVIIAAAALFCGCGVDELSPSVQSYDNLIKVTGRMTPFTENSVDTKSTKNQYETAVKNMAMFVFDSAGNKVDFQIVNSSQPLFLIDRNNEPYVSHNQDRMAACKLYILANIPTPDQTTLEGIGTESEFLATDCTISTIIRTSGIDSYGGLPMWGVISQTESGDPINLRSDSSLLVGQVLTIPLTCMMSKLTFNISLDPVQKSDYIQRFELKSWTVENAPADVLVAQPAGTGESAHAGGPFLDPVSFGQVDNGVNPIMQGGSTPMSFCCYVPEHRVLPSGEEPDYPTGIDTNSKQNYKPDWLTSADKPLKVKLVGVYTDHRNLEKEVTYTIYPGADNRKDFFVERNHEYIHNITIKGISNSKDGDALSVSLDMRVDVQQNNFKFQLERETLLDSHWEIRPIRITLDPVAHPDADHIEVEIMDGDLDSSSKPWIRFEAPTADQINASSGAASGTYCYAAPGALAYGKRRYFTTDLVTGTLKDNKLVSFSATDGSNTGTANEHAIWVYIDENTTKPTSGSTTRQATVQCRYFEKGQIAPTVTENYYFVQKSLHNITYNSHSYGIEYYEEYLYNYDAREHYGNTTDGMAWGLDGIMLSSHYPAVYLQDLSWTTSSYFGGDFKDDIDESLESSFATIPETYSARYDFYLSRDRIAESIPEGKVTVTDRGGKQFTQNIVSYVNSNPQSSFPLDSPTNISVQSAVEYCYNKNKRNSTTGKVDEINWYLPAIDEIEEITIGGYSDFDVFQDKLYWSSQPAYKRYSINYSGHWTPVGSLSGIDFEDLGSASATSTGVMFKDHPTKARATKVNNTFTNVDSSPKSSNGALTLSQTGTATFRILWLIPLYTEITTVNPGPLSDSGGPSEIPNVQYEEGACDRTEIHRVRCVYKAD